MAMKAKCEKILLETPVPQKKLENATHQYRTDFESILKTKGDAKWDFCVQLAP